MNSYRLSFLYGLIPLSYLFLLSKYEKSREGRDRYYITASYLVTRADGSLESLQRRGETSQFVFEDINQGDEVEIVYSSQRPGEIWMLKDDVDSIIGTALLSCLGLLLVAMGGGGLMLMRDKK